MAQEEEESMNPTPSEERLLDAEEIEKVLANENLIQRPTARMQLESLVKKLRKEAAGLKALEAVGEGITTSATTSTSTTTTTPMEVDKEPPKQPAPTPAAQKTPPPALAPTTTATISTKKYTTIDRFAFDAGGYNDKFVTLYISLPGIGDIPKEQIKCDFTKDSFDLIISDFNGKSYRLKKDHLEKDIDVEKSKFVVKADKVIVKLAKIKGEYGSYDYWSKLTDPKRNDNKSSKANPASSITELMKDMYESGDDQMKKMIGETMLKQRNGELGNDPMGGGAGGLGGMGDI